MNLNLIPNIESHQKYIQYFAQTANSPASSDDYILIEGEVPIQEPLKRTPKRSPGTVQLIDPRPEQLTARAKEELRRKGKRATPAPHTGVPDAPDEGSDEEKGDSSVTYDQPATKRKRKAGSKTKKSLSAASYVFKDIFSGRR